MSVQTVNWGEFQSSHESEPFSISLQIKSSLLSAHKVYLNTIHGYVPSKILKCISAFIDVCYIICRGEVTESALTKFQAVLKRFHKYHKVFKTFSVRPTGFSLSRQHSLIHYLHHIMEFGAPNGLCSSITESNHITAVKKPWQRSSHYNALCQMLTTIQQLDKLAAVCVDFWSCGKLPPSFGPPPEDEDKSGPTDIGNVMGNITLAHTCGTFISSESLLLHLLTKELQFVRCQEIWKHWPIIMTNPIFHDSLDSLYSSSSIQTQIHTTLIFI